MSKLLVLALALGGLGGCVAQPGDVEPTVTNVPRLTANGMTPQNIPYSLVTTGVLDATSAAAMAPGSDARKVLKYAADCALDSSQSLTYYVGGLGYLLTGSMGIAPGWTTSGLSSTEAAWVSACVFSRANASGMSITISDRGATSGLATTSGELTSYAIEEGAFWGNVFVDVGAIAAYSCDGIDQAANDTIGDLPNRQCAQWDGVTGSNKSPCAMNYAGLCTAVCTTSSPYAGCSFLGGTAASAVVTTFVYGTP